ncbi:response regulator transcription factor [Caulobacter sp. RHG1]|uniref:response regulator transcription factor n=1 Tax=Caulobacter sp. (strain RHG1) TaxID=2545762 RepID=UPI00155400DC|nr:response regulator transcription factor [Caulobacter sp. RHG1]NQE63573.1 Two-component response regulator [Caulobacter sp. RHG1]
MSALVLLATDSSAADGLDEAFRREGFRTAVAVEGREALDLDEALRPDLVVLDSRIAGQDAWQVLGALRRRGDTPIIMVLDGGRAGDNLQALRIGADDCVVGPTSPAELTARTQSILRRCKVGLGSSYLRVGPLEINPEHYIVTLDAPRGRQRIELTVTEFHLLAHMARQPLHVFSIADLAPLCGLRGGAKESTVLSHLAHLRKKLENAGAPGVLANVRARGYRLDPQAA